MTKITQQYNYTKTSMSHLFSDVNNTPKIYTRRLKDRVEIYICNTIEYDVKSHQVKKTIAK